MNNEKKNSQMYFLELALYILYSFLFVKSLQPLKPMGNKNIYKPWIIFSRDLPSSSISNNTLIPKAIVQRICAISIYVTKCDINLWMQFDYMVSTKCWEFDWNNTVQWNSASGRTIKSTSFILPPTYQFLYGTIIAEVRHLAFCSCTSPWSKEDG